MKTVNSSIIVGPVRLSYLACFKPKQNDLKNEMEYSAVLLIPKAKHEHLEDPNTEAKEIAAAIKSVFITKFGASNLPKVWRNPLQDGDKELRQSDGEPKNPGYWFINVKCGEEFPPKLVDGSKKTVKEGWNSGDWGLVKIRPFAYDHKGNKGVAFGLEAIQFLYKDESLGGQGPTDEGFDEVQGAASGGQSEDQGFDPFA